MHRWLTLLVRLSLASLFVVIGVIIIAEGRGWRFNRESLRLERTGMLVLRYSPEDAEVTFKGTVLDEKSPSVIPHLLPGRYDVLISKSGYHQWNTTAVVTSERVVAEVGILLFRLEPIIASITDPQEVKRLESLLLQPINPDEDPIIKQGNELWVGKQLVTRLSEPVQTANWLVERDYIVFQTGNTIRAVAIDGSNEVTLLTLVDSKPIALMANRRGSELIYRDGLVLKRATIR